MFELESEEDGFSVVKYNDIQYELHIDDDKVYEVVELNTELRVDRKTEIEIIEKYYNL